MDVFGYTNTMPKIRTSSEQMRVCRTVKERMDDGTTRTYRVYLDREIMGLSPDDPREVVHINGDGLDCRRENLMVVDRSPRCRCCQ
jgi:hypothetical protein